MTYKHFRLEIVSESLMKTADIRLDIVLVIQRKTHSELTFGQYGRLTL